MTSKLLRLGEKLSGVQGAAKPGCQHPPGAQRRPRPPPRSACNSDPRLRGEGGSRARAAAAGAGAREEQVAAELSRGLPAAGAVHGPNLLTVDSSSPSTATAGSAGQRRRGGRRGGERAERAEAGSACAGAPREAGAGLARLGGAGMEPEGP